MTALEPRKQYDNLKQNLDMRRQELSLVLPRHLSVDRVARLALASTVRTPLLLQCSTSSVLRAVMDAAALGLEPGGPLGHGFLVPYRNKKGEYECQFITGYRGMVELARRGGQVRSIEARVVYGADEFDVHYGTHPEINHRPALAPENTEAFCVYAVATLADGQKQFEVMTIDQVNLIRTRSRAKDDGPWRTDFLEMAKKTVVRRLFKYLPISAELAKAMDTEMEYETEPHAVAEEVLEQPTKAESIRSRIKQLSAVAPTPALEEPGSETGNAESTEGPTQAS